MSESSSFDKHDVPTPRTDAEWLPDESPIDFGDGWVPAEFSRQLERELAEANARSEELERDLYDERKYALRSASEPRNDTEAMRKLIADVNCEAVRVLWGAPFERERWEAIRTRCVAFKTAPQRENTERAAADEAGKRWLEPHVKALANSGPAVASPPANWWCPTCRRSLVPSEVTYEECHDSRTGGCGMPVSTSELPSEMEYICKCGLRVVPHRCKEGTEF